MANQRSTERQQSGAAAEDLAQRHLAEHGLSLLARNVRFPFGELDLVMLDGSCVVFVEVRFRSSLRFGGAVMSVDANKRRKLARAAQAWLAGHRKFSAASCRFDVLAVTPAGNDLACEWIASAFTMDDLW